MEQECSGNLTEFSSPVTLPYSCLVLRTVSRGSCCLSVFAQVVNILRFSESKDSIFIEVSVLVSTLSYRVWAKDSLAEQKCMVYGVVHCRHKKNYALCSDESSLFVIPRHDQPRPSAFTELADFSPLVFSFIIYSSCSVILYPTTHYISTQSQIAPVDMLL